MSKWNPTPSDFHAEIERFLGLEGYDPSESNYASIRYTGPGGVVLVARIDGLKAFQVILLGDGTPPIEPPILNMQISYYGCLAQPFEYPEHPFFRKLIRHLYTAFGWKDNERVRVRQHVNDTNAALLLAESRRDRALAAQAAFEEIFDAPDKETA